MPEPNSAQSKSGHSESDQQARVPLTARLLLHQSLTARRAAAIIAGFTFLIEAALTAARSGGSSDGIS